MVLREIADHLIDGIYYRSEVDDTMTFTVKIDRILVVSMDMFSGHNRVLGTMEDYYMVTCMTNRRIL
jgi:hypothetical protein